MSDEKQRSPDPPPKAVAPTMSNEEFTLVQSQLSNFAALMIGIDVEGFIDRCGRAESYGLLLDPTLYMRGSEKLAAFKELAQGAMRFKQAALSFRNTMLRLQLTEEASRG